MIGFVTAAFIIILDELLRICRSVFRMPVLAVAIGIYLPFELSVPIFIGGLIHFSVHRFLRRRAAAGETSRGGLLFASGLITGEALMGVLPAIPITVMKAFGVQFPLFRMPFGSIIGGFLLFGIMIWMILITVRHKPEDTL